MLFPFCTFNELSLFCHHVLLYTPKLPVVHNPDHLWYFVAHIPLSPTTLHLNPLRPTPCEAEMLHVQALAINSLDARFHKTHPSAFKWKYQVANPLHLYGPPSPPPNPPFAQLATWSNGASCHASYFFERSEISGSRTRCGAFGMKCAIYRRECEARCAHGAYIVHWNEQQP